MPTSALPIPPVLQPLTETVLLCPVCKANAVGKIVPGEGLFSLPIVAIGEAPGKQEAKTGRPFIGPAGRVLNKMLGEIGLDPKEIFITSVVKYLPKHITPKTEEIIHGLEHLRDQLAILKPDYILALGKIAFFALTGTDIKISNIHGQIFTYYGITCFPTFHPASALYNPRLLKILEEDFRQFALLAHLNLKRSQSYAQENKSKSSEQDQAGHA
jgi:DNA polymerase